jgi:uncharacterized membrane protein
MQNMSPGKSSLGLDANVVAGLCYVANFVCYLGLVLCIITIATDKTNKLARFHAFQALFLAIAGFIVGIGITIAIFVGGAIDYMIGVPIVTSLLGLVFGILGLAVLIGVILSAIKAFQGEIYELPIIGKFANQYSG